MALTVDQMLRNKAYNQLERAGGEAGKVSDIRQITIDGNTIVGYNKYFFFYEKTYSKEPERSLGGVIDNLNSYVTFVTPKVKLHFNALSITDYRTIMRLILEKNEFTVTCWDYINQKDVTFRAYFYPQDYPEIYQYDAEVLAIMDYEIELIGTNAKDDKVQIIYHTNPPEGMGSDTTSASELYYINQKAIVGEGKEDITEKHGFDGYRFNGWKASNGVKYTNGDEIQMVSDLILYAQWVSVETYVLSYDYGEGALGPINEKRIKIGDKIGTLPDATYPEEITVDGKKYQVYTNIGWRYGSSSTSATVKPDDLYAVPKNSTIYQVFTPEKYIINFVFPAGYTVRYTLPYGTTDIEPPTYGGGADLDWYDGTGEDANKVTTFEVKPQTQYYYGRVKSE